MIALDGANYIIDLHQNYHEQVNESKESSLHSVIRMIKLKDIQI